MKQILPQTILFVLLAVVLAVGRNALVPGGIDWVGQWGRSAASADADSVILPPSAQPGDPPFLTFAQAAAKFEDPDVIFVDARYPADYENGHIKGAILLPFEEFDDYWPGVEPHLDRQRDIVTYCSGTECELSLFLARLLRERGYARVSIFFGGSALWEQKGMPVEKTPAPPPGV